MNKSSSASLTKAHLVDVVCASGSEDRGRAADLVDGLIDLIKEGLQTDGRVMISGFGLFEIAKKNSRIGRNPQTGETMTLDARNNIRFVASQVLKNRLNKVD